MPVPDPQYLRYSLALDKSRDDAEQSFLRLIETSLASRSTRYDGL